MHLDELQRLIERSANGDRLAVDDLFAKCREHLRQMVAARMHPRLAGRCDPSDIVQEALADAQRRLPDYLARRPVPFIRWLRQIGIDHLGAHCRRHLYARSRSVYREQDVGLSDDSVAALANVVGTSSAPEHRLIREEAEHRLRESLQQLEPADRDILLMRYAEDLAIAQIAAALQISVGAAKSRVRRALERLQGQMAGGG